MPFDIEITYRIKRNSEQEAAMNYLAQDLKVFKDYAHILLLSAIVGYNNDLFVPIKYPASDGVQLTFFTEQERDIIDLIAYGRKKEQSIVKNIEKYNIFESYANGGFDLLLDKLGIDLIDKIKNDRVEILKKIYKLTLFGVN